MTKFGATLLRANDRVSKIGLALTAGLILIVGGLVMIDIVTRWFGVSLMFISNVVLLCSIWLAYAGVAETHRLDGHVGVDTVVEMLPMRIRRVVFVINEIICATVVAVVLWSAWQQLSLSFTYKVVMLGSFRMPAWIAQAAVATGMALMLIQCFAKLAQGSPSARAKRERAAEA